MKNIEHKLTIEQLQALFLGKRLVLDYHGLPNVIIYPPRYGKFIPYEQYEALIRQLSPEEQAKLSFITNDNYK